MLDTMYTLSVWVLGISKLFRSVKLVLKTKKRDRTNIIRCHPWRFAAWELLGCCGYSSSTKGTQDDKVSGVTVG